MKKNYLDGENYLRGETSHFRKSFRKRKGLRTATKVVGKNQLGSYADKIVKSVEFLEDRREEREKYY